MYRDDEEVRGFLSINETKIISEAPIQDDEGTSQDMTDDLHDLLQNRKKAQAKLRAFLENTKKRRAETLGATQLEQSTKTRLANVSITDNDFKDTEEHIEKRKANKEHMRQY